MSRRVIALLALTATSAAFAGPARVLSPRPDSVSITIYRDLVALVTETRTVDLPAESVTLELHGVVDSLIPQSAVLADPGRAVIESDYDFDRLTPDNLLAKSIGKTMTLVRTNRATGRVTQVEATLVSANDQGVVFRTVEGNEALHCSGLPERMAFTEVPGELRSEPTLSVKLGPGAAGQRQVRVSYIAKGFAWSADYVAHLRDRRMDLAGWLTIENLSATTFRAAEVQVVAGRLNLLDEEERGSSSFGDSRYYSTDESIDGQREWAHERLRTESAKPVDTFRHFTGCYPQGPGQYSTMLDRRLRRGLQASMMVESISAEDIGELEEIVTTGSRTSLAARENLADYQMYRLPDRTDLNARQTKQVAFLAKPEIEVDRFYGVRIGGDDPDTKLHLVSWPQIGQQRPDGLALPQLAWSGEAAHFGVGHECGPDGVGTTRLT